MSVEKALSTETLQVPFLLVGQGWHVDFRGVLVSSRTARKQ